MKVGTTGGYVTTKMKEEKKTGGRSETQETGDQHRRQANQIPRMTVKGSLRILAVKRV